MINIESEYLSLMAGILYGGKDKPDRTGVGTKSVFGRTIKHDMALGFPLLTTKKVNFENALTEILWILQGRTDIKYLIDNGVNYWTPNYEASGRTDGTLGKVYGYQWRNFNGVDQLLNLLLAIKKDPSSRRLIVNAWNASDLDDMSLPPCHYGFQVYINDGKMDLMWQQRSVDVFLGLPYDIAMYGILLEMLAKGNGYKPGQLIAQLGDCHLYNNHLEQAALQISRKPYELPTLNMSFGLDVKQGANNFILIPSKNMFKLNNYKSHGRIKAELAV
jgi:thymidylate synthase